MVENINDLKKRISTCMDNQKQREIYYEEDAENFVLIGNKDLNTLYNIILIESCGNFDYDFKDFDLNKYHALEKEVFGNNLISVTKEDALNREIYIMLKMLNSQLT